MISVFNGRIVVQRKIAWLLLFSFISLFFFSWVIRVYKKDTINTTYWVNHTYTVIKHIDKIDIRVAAWESFSRPPISDSFHRKLKKELDRVRELTVDNPLQQQLAARLGPLLDSLGTSTDDLDLQVAVVKAKLDSMMRQERALLDERQKFIRSTSEKSSWLLASASIMVFVFITIILLRLNKDIILRRRAEGKVRESQTWLQSILENSTSLIYIKDPQGRYVMVNRRFEEVFDIKEKAVIGHTDADFSTAEAASHYRLLDEQVVHTGKYTEIEEIVPKATGDVHLLSVKFPLRDTTGRLIGIGGIATEITERVHYQQQLIAATQEAQNAKAMQEMFLANMSHEIRTPMNGIQGMTDLLLDTPLSDQQKEFARIIKRSVNNLLVVVNDVLDFSKIKAGKMAIEKIEFRLKDVLDNVRAIFAHRVEKKGLRLLVEMDPEIPANLQGDPYRLNQVLINLVGNALKFTEEGWIRIQVTAQERTSCHISLFFSVADSGIGIPADHLPHIFDHFSQAGLDISRRYGGTGLGLAICQQLLALQGGDITVHSKEKEGTVFYFRLSYGYKGQAEAAPPVTPVLSEHLNGMVLAGRRFLVAEDNEVNQQLIDHVLRKGGGEVQLSANGEEAIRYLKSGQEYDLIIMDLQMPVMDGYAATRYIRQELMLQTPIIAMTATALVDEQLRCLEVGMNDYMTKPFEFADLYKRINTLLYRLPV
jgi:PAS domain S-box-containing protein